MIMRTEIMLTAAEVMSRQVFTLPASLSLEGAAWALMHRGVSGAPVRDDEGNLVGVLSEADLLEARAAITGRAQHASDVGDDDDAREDAAAAMEDRRVADVMTPALVAVGPNEPIREVVDLMIAHGMHRVLVLDDAGQLAGIITTVDVLRELAQGRLEPARDLGWLADRNVPAP
jgi:CBS-domain-containing membrane protein